MNSLFKIYCTILSAIQKALSTMILIFSIICIVLSACQSDSESNKQQITKSAVKSQIDKSSYETISKPNEVTKAGEPKDEVENEEPAENTIIKNEKIEKKETTPVEEEKVTKPVKEKKVTKPKKTTAKKLKEEKLPASLVGNSKTASDKKKKEKKGPLPALVFDYKTYDFGVVDHGDTVIHKFYFVNEGDAPAIISEASSSCGCTVPEYPKKPIKPGQRAFVKAVFATKGRLNTQKKSITIKANTEPNYTTLYLTGEVYNIPKKKEPIDSAKIDSIKKAKIKAEKDSLKLKKKATKKAGAKNTDEQKPKPGSDKKAIKQQKDASENKEETDYFLPVPKPQKNNDNKKKEKP